MADAVLTSLFQHKAWSNQRLIEALRAAPGDVDRRQFAVVLFTFEHTSIVDRIFKAHLSGQQHDFPSVVSGRLPDLDALSATMAETDQWYLDYVGGVSQDELNTPVAFTFLDGDEGLMTKAEMLAHIISHGAAHRGQVGKMLEALSIAGPADMVTTLVSRRRAGGD